MASYLDVLSDGNPIALFDLVEELAVGSYGTVYKVSHLLDTKIITLTQEYRRYIFPQKILWR